MKNNSVYFKIIVALLVLFVYGRSINYNYSLDDTIVIGQSERVQEGLSIENIAFFWTHNIFSETSMQDVVSYRPILMTSLAFDTSIFGPNFPKGSHLINIILAVLLAIMVFTLINKHFGFESGVWALAITSLYMLHPMKVETIVNIKGRDDLIAMVCMVGILLNVASKMRMSNWILVILLSFIGLFSKETMVVSPLIIIGFVFFIKKETIKTSLIRAIPTLFFCCIYLISRELVLKDISLMEPQLRYNAFLALEEPWMIRLAGGFSILYGIISSLVPISRLHHYYVGDFPNDQYTVYLGLILLIFMIGLGIWSLIKKKHFISFCIGSIALFAVPTSNILITIPNAYNDRNWFIPSLFLFLLIIYLVKPIIRKPGYIYIIVFIYSLMTINYSYAWKDDIALEKYYLKHSNSYLVDLVTADRHKEKKQYSKALKSINEAVSKVGMYYQIAEKKGVIYTEIGNTDSSLHYFYKTINLAEEKGNIPNSLVYYKIWELTYNQGKFEEAYDVTLRGLKNHNQFSGLYCAKGDVALFGLKDTASAIEAYTKALETYNPSADYMVTISVIKKNLEILNRRWTKTPSSSTEKYINIEY